MRPSLRVHHCVQGVSWVVDLVKLALAPALRPGEDLPTVLFYDELETMKATAWLGFERMLYIQDRCASCARAAVAAGTATSAALRACMPCLPGVHGAAQRRKPLPACSRQNASCPPHRSAPPGPAPRRRRYTHPAGRNGFTTPELGRRFRDAAYAYANFSRHPIWEQGIPPPTITYLMASGGEQVGTGAGL